MKLRLGLAALLLALPNAAQAHRAWFLPSATVLSGEENWITVDAAVSNDLFYFNHVPLRLDDVAVAQPDGSAGKLENASTGKYRSTFDIHLDSEGTWKIGSERHGMFGRYTLDGESHRLPRGTKAEEVADLIPAGATNVEVRESIMRNEIFVTLGAPTDAVFQPTGKGLELVPVTHPNDLVAGEEATFRFLIDGKPAADVEIAVIPGGSRYRNQQMEIDLKTDDAGEARVTWPEPGMYWLEASAKDDKTSLPQASERGLGYVTTLEVMVP